MNKDKVEENIIWMLKQNKTILKIISIITQSLQNKRKSKQNI
jgi:hypothetical protein